MSKASKVALRELGLEVGVILGEHILYTDHLHYGHWTKGLEPNLRNLPEAQANQCEFIASHIPDGVETILDVGCGIGAFAELLIERGYKVDCVTPSAFLADHTKRRLGDRAEVFVCGLEDLETENRYDLILFSESFQYIPLEIELKQIMRFLKDKGYLLICDFFKKKDKGKNLISGGHKWDEFQEQIAKHPLGELENIDITEQMAPTIDVESYVFINVAYPSMNAALRYLDDHHPFIAKTLRWKLKKKQAKLDRKYFSGERNSEEFAASKTYRLCLYQKADASQQEDRPNDES